MEWIGSGEPDPGYATGRHIKGHRGRVYLCGTGDGSFLEVTHKPRRRNDPWAGSPGTFHNAVFMSVGKTGPGWFWHRLDCKPETDATLYGALEVEVAGPIYSPYDGDRLIKAVEALLGSTIGGLRVVKIGFDPFVAALRLSNDGRNWTYNEVTLAVTGEVKELEFGRVALGRELVLTIGAVVQ